MFYYYFLLLHQCVFNQTMYSNTAVIMALQTVLHSRHCQVKKKKQPHTNKFCVLSSYCLTDPMHYVSMKEIQRELF